MIGEENKTIVRVFYKCLITVVKNTDNRPLKKLILSCFTQYIVFRAGVWEDNDSTLNVKCYDDPNQPNTINDVQFKDDAGISYLFHGYKLVIQFLYPNKKNNFLCVI